MLGVRDEEKKGVRGEDKELWDRGGGLRAGLGAGRLGLGARIRGDLTTTTLDWTDPEPCQ